MAGEMDNPPKEDFPQALLPSGLLACLGYILPLLAATSGLDVPRADWEDGFLADVAGVIGSNGSRSGYQQGQFYRWWVCTKRK